MRLLFAVLAALLIFTAAPAHAAGPQIGIADDRILLAGGPNADKAVLEWQEHGIQTVRMLRAVVADRAELADRHLRLGASSTHAVDARGRRRPEADAHHHRPRPAVGEPPLRARRAAL